MPSGPKEAISKLAPVPMSSRVGAERRHRHEAERNRERRRRPPSGGPARRTIRPAGNRPSASRGNPSSAKRMYVAESRMTVPGSPGNGIRRAPQAEQHRAVGIGRERLGRHLRVGRLQFGHADELALGVEQREAAGDEVVGHHGIGRPTTDPAQAVELARFDATAAGGRQQLSRRRRSTGWSAVAPLATTIRPSESRTTAATPRSGCSGSPMIQRRCDPRPSTAEPCPSWRGVVDDAEPGRIGHERAGVGLGSHRGRVTARAAAGVRPPVRANEGGRKSRERERDIMAPEGVRSW